MLVCRAQLRLGASPVHAGGERARRLQPGGEVLHVRGCQVVGAGHIRVPNLPHVCARACASRYLPQHAPTYSLTTNKLACATLTEREAQLASQVSTLLATVGVTPKGGSMRVRFVRLGSDEIHLAADGEVAVPSGPGSALRGAVLKRGRHPRYGRESMVRLDEECASRAETRWVRPVVARQLQAGSPAALGTYSDGVRNAMKAAVTAGAEPVAPHVLETAYARLRRAAHAELLGDVGCRRVNPSAGVWFVFACGKGGEDGNMALYVASSRGWVCTRDGHPRFLTRPCRVSRASG